MFDLKIELNKKILGATFLKREKETNDEREALLNYLYRKFSSSFVALEYGRIDNLDDKLFAPLFDVLFEDEYFEDVYEETLSYCNELKENYKKYYPYLKNYVDNVLKLNYTKPITAYIVHKSLDCNTTLTKDINGNAFGAMLLGNTRGEKEPNYEVPFFLHESLHTIFPPDYSDKNVVENYRVTHALIELATNNELYTLVTKENKYNNKGHDFLEQTKKELMPYWLQFLSLDEKEKAFRVGKNYNLQPKLNCQAKNFSQLVSFCQENYKEIKEDYNNQINNQKENSL